MPGSPAPLIFLGGGVSWVRRHHLHSGYVPVRSKNHDRGVAPRPRGSRLRPINKETKERKGSRELKRRAAHAAGSTCMVQHMLRPAQKKGGACCRQHMRHMQQQQHHHHQQQQQQQQQQSATARATASAPCSCLTSAHSCVSWSCCPCGSYKRLSDS